MREGTTCILCPYSGMPKASLALNPDLYDIFMPGLKKFASYYNIDPNPHLCGSCLDWVNDYRCCCGKVADVNTGWHAAGNPLNGPRLCVCGETLCKHCLIRVQDTEDFAYLLEDEAEVGFSVCPACMYKSLAVRSARRHYVNIRIAYFTLGLGCPSNVVNTLWKFAWPKNTVSYYAGKPHDSNVSYYSATLDRTFHPPPRGNK
jgi:hypothetical protein